MRKRRKALPLSLVNLKFEDLVREGSGAGDKRLVNLKVPADVLDRVHNLADRLGVTKTAAVVALLNEGLDEVRRRQPQLQRKPAEASGR